jgi:hypothetical protein
MEIARKDLIKLLRRVEIGPRSGHRLRAGLHLAARAAARARPARNTARSAG